MDSKLKIAIITNWWPSKKQPGYGVFIQEQAQILSQYVNVTIFLLKRSLIPYEKKTIQNRVSIIEKGFPFGKIKNEKTLSLWANKLSSLVQKHHKRFPFDLIHCHDHYAAFAGKIISDQIHLPYIVTLHNTSISTGILDHWKKSYISKILSPAQVVIAVGPKLQKTLQNDYKIPEVRIIPNFIDLERFYPPVSSPSLRPFCFLFVGDLEQRKGVTDIVECFCMTNDDCHLHIVGTGPEKQNMIKIAEKYKKTENLIFYGHVPNEKIPNIYRKCHAYLSLSTAETFGITVLEAMACGLPVIYTPSGGPEYIAKDPYSIMVDKSDKFSIVGAMQTMMSNYTNIDRSVIRDHVVQEFGTKTIINKIMKIYRESANI